MITKIHYNRYIGEVWLWMIFFEWINTIIFRSKKLK